ncbi:fimbrillin family protein [Prevotella sp. P2-180]|uniref:fimbrillin family protein n=1 Tax=Prevotella sp. P2-180 TaxID=2024224 RepID=UPI00114063F2|nr:fimbrillin family protein [Prevotella sp. P2-180]
MKLITHILLLLILLSSCNEEQTLSDSLRRLNISFAEDSQTRSSWHDQSDTEQKKVSYIWENSDNMLTAIKHDGQYVPFYESMSSSAAYYSKTKFETVDEAKSKIKLETVSGVKYDVNEGTYVYPVAANNNMYCCHPINDKTTVTSSSAAVTVDMPLPSTFTFDKLSNDLSTLKDYSYVYTSTTLKSVDDNAVVAKASHFNSACAIIRFNITNSTTSDIIITGIKMESDDGSKIYPNKLRFADGAIAEQDDKTGYYNKLTTSIDQVTIPMNDKGRFYNLCFPLDGNFNGVPLKFTIDTNYLTYQLNLNSTAITNNKFEAGKIYTFNFSLEEKEVKLNTIEISHCTTYNIDNTESIEIVVTPQLTWHQTGDITAQMVFVSLGMTMPYEGKTYDVLWATCNLGAKEALETGHLFSWGEVARKEETLYSPNGYTGTATTDIAYTEHDAVKHMLGEGHWFWMMPTKAMWEKMIDECDWTWSTVKKVDTGEGSEENLDFDASVWKVQKKDSEGRVTGIIYLPITGYAGLDESTNTYKKVEKARCCYWTSTPASATAGGEEKSYAFYTKYEIDPNDPSTGHMSPKDSAIQEHERYNGFAIRPVLMREIK